MVESSFSKLQLNNSKLNPEEYPLLTQKDLKTFKDRWTQIQTIHKQLVTYNKENQTCIACKQKFNLVSKKPYLLQCNHYICKECYKKPYQEKRWTEHGMDMKGVPCPGCKYMLQPRALFSFRQDMMRVVLNPALMAREGLCCPPHPYSIIDRYSPENEGFGCRQCEKAKWVPLEYMKEKAKSV